MRRNSASLVADARDYPPPARGIRLLKVNASTYDPDAHTVDAVLSTGAQVDRRIFREELEVSQTAIDLGRANAGLLPLLDSHNTSSIGAVLGRVGNVRINGGKLWGTLIFDQSPQGIAAEGLVARDALGSISIGYSVKSWELVESGDDNAAPTWRATRWELFEVSLVSVPADPGAGTRAAAEVEDEPVQFENGENMLTRNQSAGGNPPAPVVTAAISRFDAQGTLTFLDQARAFGLESQGRSLIDRNVKGEIAEDTCRSELMRIAAETQRAQSASINGSVQVLRDEGDTDNQGIEDALYSRIMRKPPSENGRRFRSMSLVDIARYQFRREGERKVDFWSAQDIATRFQSTGAFPNLTTGVGNRVLMDTFATAPNPLKKLARESTVSDFRTKYSLKLGNFPVLPLVIEGGEIRQISTIDSAENYKIGTYAGIFSLTRQAIINDDLDAFGDWARKMAMAAAETEAAQLVGLLTAASGAGPTMSDGNALFSVAHSNLAASPTAITTDTLSDARIAMRTQTGIDGRSLAPVVPKTLLVGPKKETEAEKILSSLSATTADDVNTFAGKLGLEVEPRLSGNQWFVFGDAAFAPVIEYSYLNGASGPQMDSKQGFEILGTEFRVVLDFGCGVIDYRGAYRNPGA